MKMPPELEIVNNDVGDDDHIDNDFYYSAESGMYRSHSFSLQANDDGECKDDIYGGTRNADDSCPLDLLSFNAVWDAAIEQVKLQWTTVNEVNLDYFIVEKMKEGEGQFGFMKKVMANRKMNDNEYHLEDPDILKGNNYYYRLVAIDNDGNTAGVKVQKVYVPGDGIEINAFPNPFSRDVNIVISGELDDKLRIEVLDRLGRRVFKPVVYDNVSANYKKVTLNFDSMPTGQYFIKVISGNTVKLVKVINLH